MKLNYQSRYKFLLIKYDIHNKLTFMRLNNYNPDKYSLSSNFKIIIAQCKINLSSMRLSCNKFYHYNFFYSYLKYAHISALTDAQ